MIVVDASLAAKWVLPERNSEAALQVLDGNAGGLHAPDLIMVEVAGAIVRRTNERLIAPDQADRITADWLAFERRGALELHRSRADLVARAARLAIELGHPLKDCVYLALAAGLGCPLATADAKFRDRAAGRHGPVLLLEELVG